MDIMICILSWLILSFFVSWFLGAFIKVGKGPWEDDDGKVG